jgi:hypothetical protein
MTATTVHASYAELRRMAPDALRMAGMTLAQADEAAEMLAWTVASGAGTLEHLRAGATGRAPRLVGDRAVDLGGASLLEHGLRVLDFVCAEEACVRVEHARGAELAGYLARRGALRGYAVVAGAFAAWPREDGSAVHLVEGVPAERRVAELAARAAELGGLVFAARRVRGPLGPVPVLGQLADRVRSAVDNGLELEPDELAVLTGLAAALRVPSSQRSRTQAG